MVEGSSRGPLIVIAGGALLAGALLTLYFGYLGPNRARARSQREVADFAERWIAIRTCLAGRDALSSDLGQAVIALELTTRVRQARLLECRELIGVAERPSERVADERVEIAWESFRRSRGDLATALALGAAKRPSRPPDELRAQVATAARSAELSYQALRAASGLGSDLPATEPFAAPAIEPLSAEVAASGELLQVEIENNRVTAITENAEGRALILHTSSGVQITRLAEGFFVAAAAAPGWGILESDASLVARPMANDGEAQTVATAPPGRLIGAFGAWDGERTVVTIDPMGGPALVYHSPAKGVPFEMSRAALSEASLLASTQQNLLFRRVIIQSASETLEWSATNPRDPGRYASGGQACFAESASWWQGDRGVVWALGSETSRVEHSEDMPWQERSCDDSQLLGLTSNVDGTLNVRLCSRARCPISTQLPLPAGAEKFALIAPRRGPMVATLANGVLVLWASGESGGGLVVSSAVDVGDAFVFGIVEWSGEVFAIVRRNGIVGRLAIP